MSTIVEIPLLEAGSSIQEGQSHHEEPGGTKTSTSEQKRWKRKDFKKRQCNTFIEDSSSDGRCQCGRHRDTHRKCISTAVDTKWTSELHSSEQPTDAFGRLYIVGGIQKQKRFLRLSSDTEPSVVYDLMTRLGEGGVRTMTTKGSWCITRMIQRNDGGWGWSKPDMVVSVVGGEGSPEVNPSVRKVIRQGLVKALEKPGGHSWILTEGFDEGTGRCVGEAVKDSSRVRALGITPWGFVHNRDQLVNKGECVHYTVENTTSESCCLEENHAGFLLVDDGSEGRKGGEKNFSVKLEEHISTQHIEDISVLNMLISGETTMLERVGVSLKNSTPWLVLAGSGGVADLLSDILEDQSPASDYVDVARVTEVIRRHFPSEAQTDELVQQIQSIYQNRELITFYHEEQRPEDFDTVMIKALMPASKRRASGNTFPYCKELRLAVKWNRVDFASSEFFNDDINIDWTDEALKDCMMVALINDRPQFVRLFIEKKFNIEESLTYGVLEKLYSRVAKDTLIYNLLLERLKERLGTSDLDSLKEISLFEVSGVLKKFMGEEKPFYFPVLGLGDLTSGKKALEHFKKLLDGERSYRNNVCESPWIHLFIWAVLQNHSDSAAFFWEKEAEDSVLNALSACKMLGEMSKLEIKTDTKLSMKKLAQKFGDRAHGMLNSCYQSNESHSFELLKRKSPVWNTNCFKMGIAVESHLFFNHVGLESLLSQAWRGDMKKDTALWKVLLTLILWPLLLWTDLISYREPDRSTKPKPSFVVSRWGQFWNAPVTSFLGNTVMYFPFLFLFAYVLLVDFKPPPPSGPSISEYLLYFWVFTFFCEEIYEVFFMGTSQKLYWHKVWNRYYLNAILLFIIGLICRMFEWSYEFGRCALCIDYMVFTLRLILISAINKQMGPKIIMLCKMVKDVSIIFLFLGVWIIAYGVANQALLYSYDPDPDRIFRQVLYRPYLYVFGELDVGQERDITCTNNVTQIEGDAEPCRSEYNNWLVIILFAVFLLVTNIVIMNLFIAIVSNVVEEVQEKSDHYWKFQHYKIITEYQSRPALAPPFIIFSHLHLFFSFLKKKIHGESYSTPNRHQTFEEEWRPIKVKIWETKQKEEFLKAERETVSDSERIKQISNNVQEQLTGTRDMYQRIQQISDNVQEQLTGSREMDQRFQQISDNVQKQVTETFDQAFQMMTDRVDRMEKEQQKQLKQLTEQQASLETKVQNCSDVLGQILDILAKAPWTKPPST